MTNTLSGKNILIITAGNRYRSDDGIGPYIASRIQNDNVHVLDAGDKPENVLNIAVEIMPNITIIIDAADFGGIAGEIRNLDYDSIPEFTLSTHTFPIKIIAKMLSMEVQSEIYFLGIQPERLDFGEKISDTVKAAAEKIIYLLNNSSFEKLLNCKN